MAIIKFNPDLTSEHRRVEEADDFHLQPCHLPNSSSKPTFKLDVCKAQTKPLAMHLLHLTTSFHLSAMSVAQNGDNNFQSRCYDRVVIQESEGSR